ncbi:putative ORFan [Tupanvirus deep ocean]|uniref:ORFan n=2 Tax=Tupanvirus TaxID=2094720 RepID=A0AC62A8B1_9VIRU|nr:putative ORFan [Tupanvirus deep ocean]QKU33888.1 putative ORFan [Tupanvirus deep ocean]
MESGTITTSKPVKTDSFKKFYKNNKKVIIVGALIFILFIILMIIVFIINSKRRRHINEITRIINIENAQAARKKEIEEARANSRTCTIGTYDNARDCYFGSNYKCHWDIAADRCNFIE